MTPIAVEWFTIKRPGAETPRDIAEASFVAFIDPPLTGDKSATWVELTRLDTRGQRQPGTRHCLVDVRTHLVTHTGRIVAIENPAALVMDDETRRFQWINLRQLRGVE